jgi:hypothetical protein
VDQKSRNKVATLLDDALLRIQQLEQVMNQTLAEDREASKVKLEELAAAAQRLAVPPEKH